MHDCSTRTVTIVLVFMLNLLSAAQAHAVAYCALRDPVNTIYQLFPEADNYRSHVRTVGKDTRAFVAQSLPFSLHYNELGRHTLYVAQQGEKALGFVHARSEQGEWGLNEYVWAISPNLRILGVKVQRSRDPKLRKLNAQNVVQPMVGKNLPELVADYKLNVGHGSTTINLEMLRSAIKTLFVTEHVWVSELNALSAFAIAKQVAVNTSHVEVIEDLFNARTSQQLSKIDMRESPIFDRQKMRGYRMIDKRGELLGMVFRTPFTIHDPNYPLWWVVKSDGEIQYVGKLNSAQEDFSYLVGFAPKHPRDCSSATDLAALEIAVLARNQ